MGMGMGNFSPNKTDVLQLNVVFRGQLKPYTIPNHNQSVFQIELINRILYFTNFSRHQEPTGSPAPAKIATPGPGQNSRFCRGFGYKTTLLQSIKTSISVGAGDQNWALIDYHPNIV
jgi:hypothetical protein